MTVSQPIQRPGWSSTHTYKTRWRPHASHSQHSSRLSKRLSSTTDPVRARASALQSVSTQTRQTQSSITQYLPTRNPVPNHYPAVTTNASSAIPTRPSLQQQTMASFFPSQNPNPRPHRATPVHPVHRQPTLVQTSLAGVPLRQDYGRAFGHPSNPRDSKLYRILSQNIHGLPQYATDVRSRHMVKRVSDRSIGDLHLWQELNLVPHLLPLFDSWKSRTRKTSLHSVFGINQRETHLHLLQPGGTMLTVGTRLVSRIRDSGSDHLGRWAWIRIGSEEISTVFISAYRPCLTKGATTVYQQQKRALNDNSCNPRELFFQDLSEEIQAFHQAGYNVVLGADLNEDVLSRRVRIFLEQTGLWNPILDIHGTNSPATHARNESFVAIDAILCSRGLKPSYCGYSAAGEACASDHVQLWIDFSKEELFGPGKDYTFTEAETLNSKNPVLVSKYNDQAIKQLSDALPKLQALREIPVSEFTDQDGYQYTQVYRRVRDVRKTIKSSLRHIYVGVHPWSPAWQKAQSTRILYTQVLKYRSRFNNGHSSTPAKISLTYIRRLMRITGHRDALTLSVATLRLRKQDANAAYREACKKAPALRATHVTALDQARAIANNTTVTHERISRLRIEEQRRKGRMVKQLRGKKQEPVSKVLAPGDTVNAPYITCDTAESITQACITEGTARFTQSESTPPMQPDIIALVGFHGEKPGFWDIVHGCFRPPTSMCPAFVKLLEYMRRSDKVHAAGPISSNIQLDEHQRAWQSQREQTASVKSEITFADHKSAAQHPILGEVDRLLRAIPYSTGFAPPEFCTITDFQILKKREFIC